MTWINISRIFASFAVICLHVAAFIMNSNDVHSEYWQFANIFASFNRWCVPVFVMISGALLLDPVKKDDVKVFYRKRLNKIAIPIIFWSVVYLLIQYIRSEINGHTFTILALLKLIITGVPYYHMWFLYMIVCLYLFTPFMRKFVENSRRYQITIFVIITFFLSSFNVIVSYLSNLGESKIFFNGFLIYIPYYFIGYLINTNKQNYSNKILLFVFLVTLILTASG